MGTGASEVQVSDYPRHHFSCSEAKMWIEALYTGRQFHGYVIRKVHDMKPDFSVYKWLLEMYDKALMINDNSPIYFGSSYRPQRYLPPQLSANLKVFKVFSAFEFKYHL
uniref:Uncharacterized protein n=1 Tax=Solanum lycopersicum TaxID=4081 RepID=A0A3Q7EVN2_SOLLC